MTLPCQPVRRPAALARQRGESLGEGGGFAGLIGRPFRDGGRGPEAFDCWGLVRFVEAEHFGVEVPDWSILPAERSLIRARVLAERQSERWRRIAVPEPGAVAVLGRGLGETHLGVVVDGGVLHATRDSGVVLDSLSGIRRDWPRVSFYAHRPHP